MKSTYLNAGTTLAIALLGAAWAFFAYKREWALLILPIALAAIGQIFFLIGKRKIYTSPKRAITWMQWRFLLPAFIAVVGSGLVILIGAVLTPDEGWDQELQDIVKAISGAIAAAVAAIAVGKSETPWSDWVDTPISKGFQKEFKGYFRPGSVPQIAVFSGSFQGKDGWGREARKARAEVIESALKNGTDALPTPVGGQR